MGQGRIKLRLGNDISVEQVKKNFKKAGVLAKNHTEDVRKKLVVSKEINGIRNLDK